MKKRIAYILARYSDSTIGGEPVIHFNLILDLIKAGYIVDVYCQEFYLTRNYKAFGVNKMYVNIKRNIDLYERIIKESDYYRIIGSKFALCLRSVHPDIFAMHSHSDNYSQRKKYGRFWFNVMRPRRKRIMEEKRGLEFHKSSNYVVCSKKLKADYGSLGIATENLTEILPYPNFKPIGGGEARTERAINQIERQKIITFGLSAPGFQNKGGYLALKSACLLKKRGYNFKLKIIYKKNMDLLKRVMVNLFNLSDNVEFLSLQNDMDNFYRSIDCLLMPSKLEATGMVALEAMSYGIPVVASSTAGVCELIKDGENGFIFNFSKNKAINLSNSMEHILQKYSEMKELGERAKDTVKDLTRENYYKIFIKVLEEG